MHCAFSWATRPAMATGHDPRTSLAGGDIAAAAVAADGVRLLIGDVMGHDERAAQTAAAVVRAFHRLAAHPAPLQALAARLHAFVVGHTDGEQFVTAQFVAIPRGAGHEAQIVCCGHPPPLLLRGGRATLLDALPPSPPLGLLDLADSPPRADLLGVQPGDSVLLYTDGVSEAYGADGRPYPLAERAASLGGRGDRLPGVLRDDLLAHVRGDLRDDATLLYLRFAGGQTGAHPGSRAGRAVRR